MKLICVDDENLILDLTVSLCEEFGIFDEVKGFLSGVEAVTYLENNEVDVALLDIDMPEMDGLTLAGKIKEISPDTAIIFLTGYSEYAVDAFSIHAAGYLLKPISRDKLLEEINYALAEREHQKRESKIVVHTFGNFDVFINGESLMFKRSKAKELFAYLVDQRGATVTRAEAFSALWEEGMYDRAMQKQMDVIIRSLKDTLKEYGISEILETKSGAMRVCPELIDCDLYKYLDGDENAIQSYRGAYMSQYYWASLTEASLLDDDY